MAQFKRGEPRPEKSGRRKGSINRIPKQVRQAIIEALNSGPGATAFFTRLRNGTAEDRRCFAHLCGRLLPLEVSAVVKPAAFDPQDLLEVGRRAAFVMQAALIAAQQRKTATIRVLPMPQASPPDDKAA